jgi:hypothetical protein
MFNELRDGRYSGRKKAIVEAHVLMVSIRRGDTKGCDMAFMLMGRGIPFGMLNLASLQRVRGIAESRGFLDVRDGVLAELRRRN